MRNIAAFLIASLIAWVQTNAQSNYASTGIPDTLTKNANIITRTEEISFEVTGVDRAKYKVHRVLTALNSEGGKSLFFLQFTNKYLDLEHCDIHVFDAAGNQMSKYRKKDLIRQSPQGGDLISDGMFNYVSIPATSYPLTVEFDYELGYTGTLVYPLYQIQDADESVQNSSFTLRVPNELGARYKQQRTNLLPAISKDDKNTTYTWSVSNLIACKEEKGAAADDWINPGILIAPNKFSLYNNDGDMSSWKNFGIWECDLLKNLDLLPEERKIFFRDLVKDATSDREKIARVYGYLQQNFRYVSIQLGIGGYKPFPAQFTDQNKYGDCKALSFYTYSVLKSLGIRSHVALINAEYNQYPVDPAFPCNSFNHMILCVPQKNDTIWLECTSRNIDFDYLGSFTENRYALLITEDGGVLVPTPVSRPAMNKVSVVTNIQLEEDGSGRTSSSLYFHGDPREMLERDLTNKTDEQKELIVNTLGFQQPDNFTLKRINTEDLQIDLDIEKIPQFSAGSKMFLNPRIYKFWRTALPAGTNRKTDYFFPFVVDKSDTTVYQLPAGFTIDALPQASVRKCAYAEYASSYSYNKDKNQVVSTANLVLYKNRIPADKFAEVKTFFDLVISDEGKKMVIKNN